MKNYIKPSFMFVALDSSTTVATGGCSYIIKDDEKELLEIRFGADAFFSDAICKNPVQGACKFTSGDLGVVNATAYSS